MIYNLLHLSMLPAPPFPFGCNAPKLKTSRRVRRVCHMQKLFNASDVWIDFVEYLNGGTCGTCENLPIAHARARVVLFFSSITATFFTDILNIIKSACSTRLNMKIIDVSHVTVTRLDASNASTQEGGGSNLKVKAEINRVGNRACVTVPELVWANRPLGDYNYAV